MLMLLIHYLKLQTISRSSCLKMAEEIFKEVHEEDIPKVLKVLKEDWPKHFLVSNAVVKANNSLIY